MFLNLFLLIFKEPHLPPREGWDNYKHIEAFMNAPTWVHITLIVLVGFIVFQIIKKMAKKK